ncbi:MAG: glycosyltransferase family 2 protein [Bacteroidales bacterium]|nr:glycosyltransferase family 2 protein [Bacteroidales bacterium]MDT8374624.1 glycosyltransferase family 2 protein [Bacteroidales bacterium]
MYLSIIIPMYNEAGAITVTLERVINTVMPDFVRQVEVIIVDDCSTDNSPELAEKFSGGSADIRVIRLNLNAGKGAAIAAGVDAANGDTILVQDADLELDPAYIPALLKEYYEAEKDIVSGTRFRTGRRYRGHAAPAATANRILSSVASKMTGRKITDLTCGYKLFSKALYRKLNLKEKGFGFETELMLRALHDRDTSYGETDVTYLPRKRQEGKKIRISDGLAITGNIFRYGLHGRDWRSALTIAFIIIFMTVNMLSVKHWRDERRVLEWDAISYYAYLPAAFIYHDLSLGFADGYEGPHKLLVWPEKGPGDKYVIKTTMGLSVLWLPFFLAGHAAAIVTGADAGGYSEPYKFFLLLSALLFLLTGLIYLRRILLNHASDKITALVLAAFAFGTNLYWYTLFQGTMAHVYNFALITAFAFYSMRWHEQPGGVNAKHRVGQAVRLGLLVGLISLIRPTNIIIVIFFLLYGVNTWNQMKERASALIRDYRLLLLMAVTAVVIWLPQMLYWKEMTGHWLWFSYGSDERFFFGDPAIVKGLFSWRKGLFIYTPLMIISFAGIIVLWIRRSPHALAVTTFVPLNIYIIFSWWCWWYGGGFGQRAFIDSYALMAVAAAALLSQSFTAGRRFIRVAVMTAFLLFATLGIFNNIQYYHGAIHWDSMTREAWFDSFGRVRPSARFNQLLEAPDYEMAKKGADR